MAHLRSSDYLFQSRISSSRHISTRLTCSLLIHTDCC
nr:MAG TPA_asm: hypothetical protein [Caudoviricetes sp.]